MYSIVSVFPVVCTRLIGRYFNDCNEIDNHNRIRQSDLALEKYWVTHGVYFRLSISVALGIGITYRKILFYHGVSEINVDKKILTRDYNNRAVCHC